MRYNHSRVPAPARRRASLVFRPSRAAAEMLERRICLTDFTVTTAAGDGEGSLRWAIEQANANANPSTDYIFFDRDVFSVPRTITLEAPTPLIQDRLSIIGPGESLLTVTCSGGAAPADRRVFRSQASYLDLTWMTVTGGDVAGDGGGLLALGDHPNVLLNRVVFTGNRADGFGGAVALGEGATLSVRDSVISGNTAAVGGGIAFAGNGSLFMINSTVTDNTATASTAGGIAGGGVYFTGEATAQPPGGFTRSSLVVRSSTLDNNVAQSGAGGAIGLEDFAGTLLVQNSTLSGNRAATAGGGIGASGGTGTLTLQDSTVTANAVTDAASTAGGGGVWRARADGNALNVDNTVLSGNNAAANRDLSAPASATVTVRYSAVGSPDGWTPAPASTGNLPFGADLKLGPLADNGGPTRTHMPQTGSPLLNAGLTPLVPSALENLDQRGSNRSVGGVDIGSVERSGPPTARTVYVRREAWSTQFTGYISTIGRGNAVGGYSVPNEPGTILPWVGLDRIAIDFVQASMSVKKQDLTVTGSDGTPYPVRSFFYDDRWRMGIWWLDRPLARDRVSLTLDGDPGGVSSPNGLLDGDRNGVPGGDYHFTLNVLPGDVNRDGAVLADDSSEVKKKFFTRTSYLGPSTDGYDIFHDVDGSGAIVASDFSIVKSRFFDRLPGPAPATATSLLAETA